MPAVIDQASGEPDAAPQLAGLPPDRLPLVTPHIVVDRLRSVDADRAYVTRGGRWLQVVGRDGVLQVFTVARGRLVMERDFLPDALCGGRALTPDGRRVLLRGPGGVRLVNLWTGDEVRVFAAAGEVATACTLSNDGTRVVVVDPESARVFDPDRDEPIRTLPAPVGSPWRVIASDRATTVVVCGEREGRGVARVYGGQGGNRWRNLVGFDGDTIFSELLIADGGALLAGPLGELKTQLWDLWSGEQEAALDYRFVHAFLANDTQLLAEDADGNFAVLDLETREVVGSLRTMAGVRAVALSVDGRRLAAVGGDRTEHRFGVWNVTDGRARFERKQPRHRVLGLRWSRGGDTLTLRASRLDVKVDSRTSNLKGAPVERRVDSVLAPSARDGVWWGGQRIPMLSRKDLVLLDASSGELLWSHRFGSVARSGSVSADGAWVVGLSSRDGLRVFAAADGIVQEPWPDGAGAVRDAVTHPVREEVVVLRRDGSFARHALPGGELLAASEARFSSRRARIALSPDARWLGVRTERRVTVYAVEPGDGLDLRVHGSLTGLAHVQALALGPGGRVALTDRTDVTTWDVAAGRRTATLVPLPGGRLVALGAEGGAVFQDAARPYLRWRRQLDLLERGTEDVRKLFEANAGAGIEL